MSLPELVTTREEGKTDVTVRVGSIQRNPPATCGDGGYTLTGSEEAFLYWDSVGSFLVENGTSITVDPLPGIDPALVRLPLLGPVLAALLSQRGRLVLHASAVSVDGQAVAFMGDKGWGKSTTAAALHARGHPLVADDVLAVYLRSDTGPSVTPGVPRLKLRSDAVRASLGGDPASFPRLHRRVSKRGCETLKGFAPQRALPLHRVYVLGRGEKVAVRSFDPQQAFLELLRHTYDRRLASSRDVVSTHFQQCTQVARRIQVKRLERTPELDDLSSVACAIDSDLKKSVTSS